MKNCRFIHRQLAVPKVTKLLVTRGCLKKSFIATNAQNHKIPQKVKLLKWNVLCHKSFRD